MDSMLPAVLLILSFLRLAEGVSQPREISVKIEEEMDVGKEVVKIQADDNSVFIGQKKLDIDYQFFSSETTEKFFSLNSKTGRVVIRRKIDRDNLCNSVPTCCPRRSRNQCVLQLSVRSDSEYHFVYILRISVQDINDNGPHWTQSEITAQFSEASTVGEFRSLSTALDADSGANGIQRYEMEPQVPEFQLEYVRGTSGQNDGELRLQLQQKLDRETVSNYDFMLFAVDGGEKPRTGSVKVRVVVTDENDNKPVFDQKMYTGSIKENAESNEPVIKVSATDKDIGAYGQVEFHISPLTKTSVRRLFSIDTLTGMIRVQGNIDYEQEKSLKLLIEASDRGTSPRKSHVTVELKVTDENDNYPVVHLQPSTGSSNNFVQIAENRPMGTLVAAFSVTDRDSGPRGKVTCNLGDTSFFGLQVMNIPDTVMYRLQTGAVLDREEVPLHSVLVICEDEGTPALTSTTTMRVRVLDQNDETPRFSPEHYFQNVREDMRVGSYVFTLNASDRDDGNNGQLNYWIAAETRSPFKVERLTGQVRLQEPLDRETQDRITFVVYAHDLGEPTRRTGSATVSVTVIDANDNSPILNPLYYFSIPENRSAGASVGFINATDKDKDRNAQLSYQLIARPYGRVKSFHITPRGELLVIHSNLDRERQPVHKFLVRVTDNGRPRRTSTSSVTITVTDVNDCKPRFIFPRKGNDTIFISHRARSGQLVGRVIATDDDSGPNKEIVYSYRFSRNGQALSLFQLDPVSGELRLDRDLTAEDVRIFHLLVEAKDRGRPPLSSISVLNFKVQGPSAEDPDRDRSPRKVSGDLLGQNLIVIIALVAVTAIFVLVLISAILILSCKRRQNRRRGQDGAPGDPNWEHKEHSKTLKLGPGESKWLESQPDFNHEMECANRDLTVLTVGPDGGAIVAVDPCEGKGLPLDHPAGREETVYQALSKFNTNIRNPNLNTTDDLKRSLKHQYETLVQDEEAEYDTKGTMRPQPGAKLFDDRLSPIDEANAGHQRSFNPPREMEYFYDNQTSTLKKKNQYQPVMGASFV